MYKEYDRVDTGARFSLFVALASTRGKWSLSLMMIKEVSEELGRSCLKETKQFFSGFIHQQIVVSLRCVPAAVTTLKHTRIELQGYPCVDTHASAWSCDEE